MMNTTFRALAEDSHECTQKPRRMGGALVHPVGIEPTSPAPEANGLSIILWVREAGRNIQSILFRAGKVKNIAVRRTFYPALRNAENKHFAKISAKLL